MINNRRRCAWLTAAGLILATASRCLAGGPDELVFQNRTGQRLVVQVTGASASADDEPTVFEAPPRKCGSMRLTTEEAYTITLHWIALEGRRIYEFRADSVPLRDFLRLSKTRPTTRRVLFRMVARSDGDPLERTELPAGRQWLLALSCAATRTEAVVDFPQLAIADPSRPVPRASLARRPAVGQ